MTLIDKLWSGCERNLPGHAHAWLAGNGVKEHELDIEALLFEVLNSLTSQIEHLIIFQRVSEFNDLEAHAVATGEPLEGGGAADVGCVVANNNIVLLPGYRAKNDVGGRGAVVDEDEVVPVGVYKASDKRAHAVDRLLEESLVEEVRESV